MSICQRAVLAIGYFVVIVGGGLGYLALLIWAPGWAWLVAMLALVAVGCWNIAKLHDPVPTWCQAICSRAHGLIRRVK